MIKKLLSKIGIDKLEHCVLASTASVVLKWLFSIWCSHLYASALSFVIVIVACVGKEVIYDKWAGKGTPELKDIWAGVVGTLIGIL